MISKPSILIDHRLIAFSNPFAVFVFFIRLLLLLFLTSSLFAKTLTLNSAVELRFNQIKSNPNALYAFLKEMPKGGELHYHLAGGAYPENLLALAARANYCLDQKTFMMIRSKEACSGLSARELSQNPSLYNQTLRAWSMKDFVPGQESSHDHFFSIFIKFHQLIEDLSPQLLSEIMLRAVNQNELYLEILILADKSESIRFAKEIDLKNGFDGPASKLLANKDFEKNIQFTVDEARLMLQKARHQLGCEQNPQQPVCKITIKFQYYVLREQSLEKVFAQALNGFAAIARSKDLVGINLVQAEDGIISLRDYHQQMKIFNYLHKKYPQVSISLHAGELAPSAVTPENLRFHIQDAIATGQAKRIGHGVSIGFEDQSNKLIKEMAKNKIAVEINLISNKEILNISGVNHPLTEYLAQKVPVVLSTDDEGILRTDLTRQYVEAVFVHGLDYQSIKQISRNALIYSFLPGKSLWLDGDEELKQNDCKDLNSATCLQFIRNNEKAKLERQLELDFIQFEKKF